MAPVKSPSISLAACLCALVCACTTSPDVGGVWHVEAPVNKLFFGTAKEKPLGVELVMGTYGPDIAGLVRYYRSGLFDQALSPLPPYNACECAFLHQAKVDATGRVTFELNACVPGTSPNAPLALRGELTLADDGRLLGTLTVDDPSQPDIVDSVPLTFVRVATTAESDGAILDCQHPATLADGNTASGL
jgi:hypothetical protein